MAHYSDQWSTQHFACTDDDCLADEVCDGHGCASDAVPCENEACYFTDPCDNEACYTTPALCVDEACDGANHPCTDANCVAFAGFTSDDHDSFSHLQFDPLQFLSSLHSLDNMHNAFHGPNFSEATTHGGDPWSYRPQLPNHHPSVYGLGGSLSATPGSLPGTPMTTFSMAQSVGATPGSLSSMEGAPTVTAGPASASIPAAPLSASTTASFMLPPSLLTSSTSLTPSSEPAHPPSFLCKWVEDPSVGHICGETFADEGALQGHCKEAHLHNLAKEDAGFCCQWFGCERRNPFNQKSKLERHLQVHTGYKPVKCSICGQALSAKQSLDQHMRTHTGEKPWVCSFNGCGQAFKQQSALTMHQRTHTGDKPLQCEVCGKRFGESSNLSKHRKTHNVRGAHTCSLCSKDFHRLDQLRRHMKIHRRKQNGMVEDEGLEQSISTPGLSPSPTDWFMTG